MRSVTFIFALGLGLFNLACGRGDSASQTNLNSNGSANAGRAGSTTKSRELGATSSHGGGSPAATTTNGGAAPATAAAGGDADRALANTAEYDERIEKAAAKADASGASAADKKAAAEAYLARGNVYRDAGNPRLYKFALGDYRRVLRYDPDNREAKEKMDEIVNIYKGMGRPVPTNGLEQ